MRHEDLQLLITPYALGVAEERDRSLLEEHLDGCITCQAELDRQLEAASALGEALDPVPVPAGSRAALLARLEAVEGPDAAAHGRRAPAATAGEEPRGATVRRIGSGRSWAGRRWASPALAAACLALAVTTAGLFARVQDLQEEVRDVRAAQVQPSSRNEPAPVLASERVVDVATSGTLRPVTSQVAITGGEAVVVLHNMPAPPAGRAWQAWVIDRDDEQPRSLATLPRQGGMFVLRIGADELRRAGAFALTLEPDGGSRQPTTSPQAVAAFA